MQNMVKLFSWNQISVNHIPKNIISREYILHYTKHNHRSVLTILRITKKIPVPFQGTKLSIEGHWIRAIPTKLIEMLLPQHRSKKTRKK